MVNSRWEVRKMRNACAQFLRSLDALQIQMHKGQVVLALRYKEAPMLSKRDYKEFNSVSAHLYTVG